jgi:hypothetical protein
MLNSTILDVALGLCGLYILLSLTCSAINEYIAHLAGLRSRDLERGIAKLLGEDPNLLQRFWTHHVVASVKDDDKRPSYLSARSFATALLDLVVPELKTGATRSTITQIQPAKVQQALLSLYDRAEGDIGKFRTSVEAWFNDSMDRVTGWYKRRTQKILFAIGVIIVGVFNVDSLAIGKRLFVSPALQKSLVDTARKQAPGAGAPNTEKGADAAGSPTFEDLREKLETTSVISGWPGNRPGTFWEWILRITGLLLTALAISFGAPFWFDVLGRISNLRSAGAKPRDATQ